MKPLSRISSAQYSPRRQSRWVLADYGGKDLWKRWVLSQEWNSEFLMDGESGEQEGGVKKCYVISRVIYARLTENVRWLIGSGKKLGWL